MPTVVDTLQWFSKIVDLLDHWQTLVAGLLALLGAWLTVRDLRRQIDQTHRLDDDRRLREERGAKSVLSLALSELADYAIDCIKLALPYAPAVGAAPPVPAGMQAPPIPVAILEPMQACAKFADRSVGADIAALLGLLQIQHSRLESLVARAGRRSPPEIWTVEAIGAVMDAAELHARCGDLFPYARGSKPDPNLTFQQQLQTALQLSGVIDVDHPQLADAVRGRVLLRAQEGGR